VELPGVSRNCGDTMHGHRQASSSPPALGLTASSPGLRAHLEGLNVTPPCMSRACNTFQATVPEM
jgi:hypothetical protein